MSNDSDRCHYCGLLNPGPEHRNHAPALCAERPAPRNDSRPHRTVMTLGQLEDLAAYVADAEGVVTIAIYVQLREGEAVLHADLRDEHGRSVDDVAITTALPGTERP